MNAEKGIVILSTFPNEESVLEVAKEVIGKRLCACVNFTRVRSLYTWKNSLEDHEEFIAFFKTTESCSNSLKGEIESLHPYDVPEIVELHVHQISESYMSWLIESTNRITEKSDNATEG